MKQRIDAALAECEKSASLRAEVRICAAHIGSAGSASNEAKAAGVAAEADAQSQQHARALLLLQRAQSLGANPDDGRIAEAEDLLHEAGSNSSRSSVHSQNKKT